MNRRLRIGIDAHAIGPGGTGNARFIANVITQLQRSQNHDLVLYFTSSTAAKAWPASGAEVRVLRPATPLIRIPVGIPRAARRDQLDVMLVQYSASARIPCPVVTVVHDVSFAAHPDFFSRTQRVWMPKTIPDTMRRAAAVITVSEFSKSEIVKHYGVAKDRVVVAPDAPDVSLARAAEDRGDPPIEPPYFLALGTVETRKNIDVAIRALGLLRAQRPAAVRERLVVVGRDGYGAADIRRAAEDFGGVEFLGYAPDAQVAALLSRATALVYPSRYEGFGLPVIEAMAAGTPALVSDIPVMQEIAGDAAVRLPPDDERAWADAFEKIATDPGYRSGLVERGTARARDFSWERTANVVLSVLENAAGSESRRGP